MRLQRSRYNSLALMILLMAMVMLDSETADAQQRMRFATYNVSMFGKTAGEVYDRLADGEDEQASNLAKLVQKIRPDVLLLNELDYDKDKDAAQLLARKFFAVSQGEGYYPLEYPFVMSIPTNTGIDSEMDLDKNGKLGEPTDAFGYGEFPGQYGMAIFSRYQIIEDRIRTFQNFLWKDMKDAKRPVDPDTGKPYYDDETWNKLRLSSKNHVDIPVLVIGRRVHILASHPTPPVFDGKEDRNGCRNHDEIKFWTDYLIGEEGEGVDHIVDDNGKKGGIDAAELVVVMGDLNSDPNAGESQHDSIKTLLEHPRLQDVLPKRDGAASGDSSLHTAQFGEQSMRIDYVIPDARMHFRESHVVWPANDDPDYELIGGSDHRMVWVKVEVP